MLDGLESEDESQNMVCDVTLYGLVTAVRFRKCSVKSFILSGWDAVQEICDYLPAILSLNQKPLIFYYSLVLLLSDLFALNCLHY